MDLARYQGKRVTLTLNLKKPNDTGSSTEELDGTVDLVNGPAMILKPRGSTMTKLIELADIVPDSVQVVPEKPRELKARRLEPLSLTNARHHLLDRHEYHLKAINTMTDEQAHTEHEQIDHSDLGHYHAERSSDEEILVESGLAETIQNSLDNPELRTRPAERPQLKPED